MESYLQKVLREAYMRNLGKKIIYLFWIAISTIIILLICYGAFYSGYKIWKESHPNEPTINYFIN